VLSAVRRQHGATPRNIRKAVQFLAREVMSEHPLSDDEMSTDGSTCSVEKLGKLVNASKDGHLAMEQFLDAHFLRIDRDAAGLPIRLFPFTRARPEGPTKRRRPLEPLDCFLDRSLGSTEAQALRRDCRAPPRPLSDRRA
jgi:hypothetical protein